MCFHRTCDKRDVLNCFSTLARISHEHSVDTELCENKLMLIASYSCDFDKMLTKGQTMWRHLFSVFYP